MSPRPAGDLPTPAREYAVEFLSADPNHPGFLCYAKDNKLARAGWNSTPVGVPAD